MSVFEEISNVAPIFKSVSSSTKQLFQLLNCIRFAPKVHIQISEEGLRFAADEARVMQGDFAFRNSKYESQRIIIVIVI